MDAPIFFIAPEPGSSDYLPGILALGHGAAVVRVPMSGVHVWVICDPQLARDVLTDKRLSKDHRHAPPFVPDPLLGHVRKTGVGDLALSEGAEHARLRRLYHAAFNPRAIRDREPAVRELATRLAAAMPNAEDVDLVEAYAYPIAVGMISEMIGLPVDVRPSLRAAGEVLSFGGRPDAFEPAEQLLFGTLERLVVSEPERLLPGMATDLLSLAEAEPAEVSKAEIAAWMGRLFIPGHESPASLISSSLYHFLRMPSAHRPRSQQELAMLIEETLRHDPPVLLSTYRFAVEDVVIGGFDIPKGAPVLANLASANRDAAVFACPAEFQPGREPNAHVSFGLGPHFCTGAALSRLEASVALEVFVAAFPDAWLVEDGAPPAWQGQGFRRLPRLPTRLR